MKARRPALPLPHQRDQSPAKSNYLRRRRVLKDSERRGMPNDVPAPRRRRV